MIDFKILETNEMVGGLNFQITPQYRNSHKNINMSIKNINFRHSISISEYTFCLLEYYFVKSLDIDNSKFYHYSINFHDRISLNKIILELNNFLKNLEKKDFFLNWTTDELEKFIDINKNNHKFLYNVKLFITDIIMFLNKHYNNEECLGIYVIGI